MNILRIVPLILGLLLGGFSLKTFSDFKIKKLEKHHRRILTEKKDSINFLQNNWKQAQSADSIKGEFIAEMQKTMQQLKRENTSITLHARALEAWKADAADGVVTDTVTYKVNIFGKRKKVK